MADNKSTLDSLADQLKKSATKETKDSANKMSASQLAGSWRDTTNNLTFGQRARGMIYETTERETLGKMGALGEAIQMYRSGQSGLIDAFKRVGKDILKNETLGKMGILGDLINAHYKLDGIKDIIDKSAIDPNKKYDTFVFSFLWH